MLESIADVLVRRDGLDREDAHQQVEFAKNEIKRMIDSGCGLFDVEDYIQDEFGLEPDYMMELL